MNLASTYHACRHSRTAAARSSAAAPVARRNHRVHGSLNNSTTLISPTISSTIPIGPVNAPVNKSCKLWNAWFVQDRLDHRSSVSPMLLPVRKRL